MNQTLQLERRVINRRYRSYFAALNGRPNFGFTLPYRRPFLGGFMAYGEFREREPTLLDHPANNGRDR